MGKWDRSMLNETFQDPKTLETIKRNYKSSSPCKFENYELVTKPFRVLKFKDLINENSFLEQLEQDLLELDYTRKDNDLYNLKQSVDLNNCPSESVSHFIQVMKSKVEPLLASVIGVTLNGTLSATASLYNSGEYLLCHDDRCDDRCIAFVFYLTEKNPEAGGHFKMFEHDVENGQPTVTSVSIPPESNSFICFEVGNYSYHEVGEIMNDDFKRLSINGWFHSDNSLNVEGLNYVDPMPSLYQQVSLETPFKLDEFISSTYCTPSNIILAQGQFENDSFILLSNFFKADFYKACAECLKNCHLSWRSVGPANRRKYDFLELDALPEVFKKMVNFLRSPIFISYLKDITGLDLVPISREENSTQMALEVQKWNHGSYTMATDNDAFFHVDGLDMVMYFNGDDFLRGTNNHGGCTTYLASATVDNDSSSSLDDVELLTIEPQDNALVLVYRTSDTVRFTKYINHFNSGFFHSLSATYYEP